MGKSITQDDIDNFYKNQRSRFLKFLETHKASMKMIVVFRTYFLKCEFDLHLDLPQYKIIFQHPLKKNDICEVLRVGIKNENEVLWIALNEFIKTFEKELFGTENDLSNLEKDFIMQESIKRQYASMNEENKKNRKLGLILNPSYGLNVMGGNGGNLTNASIINILKNSSV